MVTPVVRQPYQSFQLMRLNHVARFIVNANHGVAVSSPSEWMR
jgi:hypothetical protein